jgi:hypothetical protein
VFTSTVQAKKINNISIGTDCIDAAEMKTIASHFTQFANIANKEYCNDDSKTWHLLSSIMFMRNSVFANNASK